VTSLRVERADCLVLVEDLGRPGWAHLGVPRSGALDPVALALANRLVGNPESHAGLEILLGGLRLLAEGSVRLALVGAHLPMQVDGRAVAWGTPVSVPAGSRVEVGRAVGALRGWLAVAGGIDVPLVLGSRSADTLTALGPGPVRAGDRLRVGEGGPVPEGTASAVPDGPGAATATLRLRMGPRDDWFTAESLAALWAGELEVSTSSDRVALRLRGEPLVRRVAGELPSEGLVTGAVQVPGDGQPLVFLADHPTTGGYPVVAVVDEADLWQCAQLRPGEPVSFTRAARR
jgi:biotin-dependent carboxylase-like uncharacterized protein